MLPKSCQKVAHTYVTYVCKNFHIGKAYGVITGKIYAMLIVYHNQL